ncbi:MAG: HlyD family type I secretion periplasmic adaptor subunit [Hydrogenophaga sp.]|nr:HlyD family type I secretion periplasmic adaptor subunit [Hydrogenophaga sp.]
MQQPSTTPDPATPAPAPAPAPTLFARILDDLTHIEHRSDAALRGPRLTMLAITALVVVFLVWAAWFTIDELVRAEGRLIPPQRVQAVQSAEGGIVAEVRVADGDAVRAGQTLLTLDGSSAQADLAESQRPYLASLAALTRLDAELQNQPVRFPPELSAHGDIRENELKAAEASRAEISNTLATVDQKAEQRRQSLQRARAELRQRSTEERLMAEEMTILRPLVPAVVSRAEWLSKEREWLAVQGAIEGLTHQVAEHESGLRELQAERARTLAAYRTRLVKEAGEHQSQVAIRQARAVARRAQVARTEVTAPVDGVVKQLHARAVGQVVQPGATLLDLVPHSEQLTVEARVTPADVGFVALGQPARVKVATYDFAIYGAMNGVVESISADTLSDRENPQAPPYYRVTVAVRDPLRDRQGQPLALTPGMTVSLDIVTGQRSVLTYLFKPLVRGMNQALGEK